MSSRVIKLGGSLLRHARTAERLKGWLAGQPAAWNVVVVGGGAPVNWLRDRQQSLGLSDEAAHFAAIEGMARNAADLHREMVGSEWVSELALLKQRLSEVPISPGILLFDCRSWARTRSQLPRNWNTTSDSLAAEIACEIQAEELVLLKSILPLSANRDEIAHSPLVDLEFRNWAPWLGALRIVQFSLDTFPEILAGD